MTTSMIVPQPAPAVFSTSTLGAHLSMALGVLRADNPVRMAEALPIAQEFARLHGFGLTPPPDLEAPDAFGEFEEMIVPYFRRRMRPVFVDQLQGVARGPDVYDEFEGRGLGRVNLPDLAMAGLLSFDAVDGLYASLERDIARCIGELPPHVPAKNPYFKAPYILGRLIPVGLLLAGGLVLVDNAVAVVGASVGLAAAVEGISFFLGKNSHENQIVASRERAARADDLKNTLERVRVDRIRLGDVRDRIP